MSHEGVHLFKPGYENKEEMRARGREVNIFTGVMALLLAAGVIMCFVFLALAWQSG